MSKRTVAIAGIAAVVTMLCVPKAQAQDADVDPYGAGATATALLLRLLDQELTFASTAAAVGSEPEAAADGQAAAIPPLFESPGAPVASTGALVASEDCELDEALPEPVDLLAATIACVETRAEVADGSPEGTSASSELVVDIISAALVGELTDAVLRPLLEELLAGLDTILAELDEILGEVPAVDTLIDLVLADLENGGTVANIEVAPTSSHATDVESRAESQGAVITLLPDLLLDGGALPLAVITVGDAFSSAAYDPATDEVALDGQAAFVDVDLTGLAIVLDQLVTGIDAALGGLPLPPEISDALAGLLGDLDDLLSGADEQVEELVNVSVDELACPASPLAVLLCFQAGGVTELDAAGLQANGFAFGDGTRGIEAEVLGLSVLDDTISLGIGQTAAGANAELDAPAPPPADPTDQALPRTGGDPSTLLALGLFAAAVAGIAMIRRTGTIS